MQLYHGTNADNIISIINHHQIKPNYQKEIFFGRYDWRVLFMHGGDTSRKAAFVISVEVDIPNEIKKQFTSTQGVQNTLKVVTNVPLPAKVLELFVRKRVDEGYEEMRIKGEIAIKQYLLNNNVFVNKL
jgi:hypothetical protein